MSRNSLSTDQQLFKGDFLMSNNQEYKAIFQDDGNFVIYKWSPIWAPNTANDQAFKVIQQGDAHLVIYTIDDKPIWASGSYNNTHSVRVRLTLTDEGHLATSNDGVQTWSSKDC
ncbi:B-type lectin plumieribetin-like [Gadus chalcogrammus]|uniref:B-type lectin plumieribetin-like n=1 Tax=Gadus chalcogrammus TaxID=1042646 RepID=UPI0024C325A6|nr:B-type lectin plumieribetin-like [Gadus chalcogrammus]